MNTPSPITDRIVSLDVLRGFALLGILLMNIQSFSMPGSAYLNPFSYGDMQGANYWVWAISHVLADQKFMSIFSMLFGVGILVFTQRLEEKGISPTRLHYRRTFWLLVFGLLHGYLMWMGDILFSYAMCGFLVYLLRHKSANSLLVIATILVLISFALNMFTGFSIPYMPAEALKDMNKSWAPEEVFQTAEIAAYTGGFLSALKQRAGDTFFMQSYVFLTMFLWRASGMMLIGMALYKKGFFNLSYTNKRYTIIAIVCISIGLMLILTGLTRNLAAQYSLNYSMFIGSQFNYWGSIFMSIGYAALIMLMVKNGWFSSLQKRLAAVGKTAFSNYILHTLICTTLFYYVGLLGQFSRLEQLMLVVTIWVIQLIVSPIWLLHFKFGPLEWAWRSLTYWQSQPMKSPLKHQAPSM